MPKQVKISGGPLLSFGGGELRFGRTVYKTLEHFFQALKARDIESHRLVKRAKTARDAKIAGRAIPMRDDWEEIKFAVMVAGDILKFALVEERRELLLDTKKHEIVEDRPDPVWGIGRDGNGMNLKGKSLMAARSIIRESIHYGKMMD